MVSRQARTSPRLSYLDELEAESIFVFREVAAQCERPVILYSIGKDSSVLLRLAIKAFAPQPVPFPLLHVDTGWKFREMITFRDLAAKTLGFDLLVERNEEQIAAGMNPFDHPVDQYTYLMKTQPLLAALEKHRFDAAIGGARRDEEKSRAKERVFSFRNVSHRWDPKDQRPEPWQLYNARKAPGETIRVFPLSNWTELDIWEYIGREEIPVVPLYFSKPRPVVERNGILIAADDARMKLGAGEKIHDKAVRFRTLGCYPLTAAVESRASTVAEIVSELRKSRHSERAGRLIDHDRSGSMERKKHEGYF
jgi:sulfate adenylyltransferase subunit 2